MANFEADFRGYLISNPAASPQNTDWEKALQALHLLVAERIHPLRIEQNSDLPAIAYQIDAKLPYQTQEGSAGLYQRPIKIDFVARSYSQIVELSDALIGALHNFRGLMENTEVDIVTYENSEQGFDDEAQVFFMTVSFSTTYKP